jgi:hypothetical protein
MVDSKVTRVELGQFYKDENHFDDDNIYLVTNAYTSLDEAAYQLTNIKTGCAYTLPKRNINMIFAGDIDDFVLIRNVEITIS